MTTVLLIIAILAGIAAACALRRRDSTAQIRVDAQRVASASVPAGSDWDFVVVDADDKLPATDVVAYAAAQQRQVREQFAPRWRCGAGSTVRAASSAQPPHTGEVQVIVHAKAPANQQDALGYHDRQPDGTPLIHVFLDLCDRYGDAWTSVASHEVLEVLGDPYLLGVFQTTRGMCAAEVADPVQGSPFVAVDGVRLSNFVFPAWFAPDPAGDDRQYDYLGVLKAPLQVASGGYSQFFDPLRGWQVVGAATAYRAHVASLGLSRGARRVACRPAAGSGGSPSAAA